jgi:hypothetical protein
VRHRHVVCVHAREQRRAGERAPALERRDEPEPGLPHEAEARIAASVASGDLGRAVDGPVVHHDRLEIAEGLGLQGVERLRQGRRGVPDG